MTALVRVIRRRRSLIVVLCLALAGLMLAGTASSKGSTVFRFHLEIPESFPTALPECLPPDLVGTQSGTEITDGQVVVTPSGGTHVHGTSTLDYRVDFPDCRSVLGTAVGPFSFSFTPGGTVTSNLNIKEPRMIYSANGEPVGRVLIHANSHLTFHDANGNSEPEDGEIASSVDQFLFTCK